MSILKGNNKLCNDIKDTMLDSVPDIWEELKASIYKKLAEQLLKDLEHISDTYGKIIHEQVNEIPITRKVELKWSTKNWNLYLQDMKQMKANSLIY